MFSHAQAGWRIVWHAGPPAPAAAAPAPLRRATDPLWRRRGPPAGRHQFHGNGTPQRRSVARLPVPYGGPSQELTNPGSEWGVSHIVGQLLASGVAPTIFWAEETPKEAPSLPWMPHHRLAFAVRVRVQRSVNF